eukprot:1137847-Pelagomonas_calceolata.AAC.9
MGHTSIWKPLCQGREGYKGYSYFGASLPVKENSSRSNDSFEMRPSTHACKQALSPDWLHIKYTHLAEASFHIFRRYIGDVQHPGYQ